MAGKSSRCHRESGGVALGKVVTPANSRRRVSAAVDALATAALRRASACVAHLAHRIVTWLSAVHPSAPLECPLQQGEGQGDRRARATYLLLSAQTSCTPACYAHSLASSRGSCELARQKCLHSFGTTAAARPLGGPPASLPLHIHV